MKYYCPKALEVKLRTIVDKSMERAKIEKEVSVNELTADIYADPKNSEEIRNILPFNPLTHSTVGKAVNV